MKKNRSVHTILFFAILSIGILLLFITVTLYLFKQQEAKIIYKSTQEQFDNEINGIILVNNRYLNQITWDYTYWGEFLDAINKKDKEWFINNISTIISSFYIDYVCLYDKDYNLSYEAAREGVNVRNIIPVEALKEIDKRVAINFYISTSEGVFFVSGASVHPSDDPTHKATPPGGYLFIAKHWNNKYLKELSDLTASSAKIFSTTDIPDSSSKHIISAVKELKRWDEKTIGKVVFTKEFSSLKIYKTNSVHMIAFLLGSVILILIVLQFSIYRWVLKPIRLVTSLFKTQNIDEIQNLRNAPVEFNQIGQLFERHLAQKADLIKARLHAEESDRLKSAFLANMSHEIRTPMNGIMGFAGLLREPDITDEQRNSYIKIIEESGNRMLNIINDLISISIIESGQLKLHVAPFNVNELMDYIYAFFNQEVEKKGIHLSVSKQLNADEAILNSDREKVYAILTNLVKNASKYTHSGKISFGYECREDHFLFFIHDTGIGISKEKQKVIFERFVQADDSISRDYEGVGLGLAIVKAFVDRLGGKIWLESEPGVGSSFYFTLPR